MVRASQEELYGSLIEIFSKDGDLIIDIGSMQKVSSIKVSHFHFP